MVEGAGGVIVLDPATGETIEARIPGPVDEFVFARVTNRGVLRIVTMSRQRREDSQGTDRSYDATVYRLDENQRRLVVEAEFDDAGYPYWVAGAMSPSGRYWLKLPSYSAEDLEIIEIDTGERTPLPAKRAGWLAGDRLVWLEAGGDGERRLLTGWPGDGRLVQEFPGGMVQFVISPDRRRVVVSLYSRGTEEDAPRHAASGWILDTTTDRLDAFEIPRVSVTWADNDRLALIDSGFVGLASRETPTEVETLLGSRPY